MSWLLKRSLLLPALLLTLGAASAALPDSTTVARVTGDTSLRSAGGSEFEILSFPARDAAGKEIEPAYRMLIQGGLHGNEEQGSQFVLWVAKRYARGESPLNDLAKEQIAFDFLPFANPDGGQEKSRYNARGVNLNRNFGVLWGLTKENPGAASFSEPETKAIRALFLKRHYAAAVDVHGYINWVVSPSAPQAINARGGKTTKAQATAYRRWVGAIKDEMPLLSDYQLKNGADLGDGGAFEDWAWWTQGTYAFCFEMETFERFVNSYRHDFNDLSANETPVKIDLFKRYELFLARMFTHAVELKRALPGALPPAGTGSLAGK